MNMRSITWKCQTNKGQITIIYTGNTIIKIFISCFNRLFYSLLCSANNTSTIKGGVANPAAFAAKPEVLMWGMFCVMIVAATWDILSW